MKLQILHFIIHVLQQCKAKHYEAFTHLSENVIKFQDYVLTPKILKNIPPNHKVTLYVLWTNNSLSFL